MIYKNKPNLITNQELKINTKRYNSSCLTIWQEFYSDTTKYYMNVEYKELSQTARERWVQICTTALEKILTVSSKVSETPLPGIHPKKTFLHGRKFKDTHKNIE